MTETANEPPGNLIWDGTLRQWVDPNGDPSPEVLAADQAFRSRYAPIFSPIIDWPETYPDSWHHAQADFSQTTQLLVNGEVRFRRHWFPAGYLITRLGVNVTVAGTTGAVVRLGVFDDSKGFPANLIADAGAQDATATGYNPVAVAITIPTSGWYNLAAVCQGNPGTAPTVRVGRPLQPSKFPTSGSIIDGNNYSVVYKTGVTGAWPNQLGGVASGAVANAYCIGFSGLNPTSSPSNPPNPQGETLALTGGVPMSLSLASNDLAGVTPSTWAVVSGNLPPGLTLAPNGTLAGTPTLAGSYSFRYQITDSVGATGLADVSATVTSSTPSTPGPVAVDDIGVTEFEIGTNHSFYPGWNDTLGAIPSTFTLVSGSLPPGLTMSGEGYISGTPTTAGTYAFVYRITDSNGQSDTASASIIIPVVTTPPPNPNPGSATTARFFYGGTGIFHTTIADSIAAENRWSVHPRSQAIVNSLANGSNDRGLTTEGYATSVVDVDPAGDTYQVIMRNDSIYNGAWGGSGNWGFNNATFLYPTVKIQPGAQVPSGTDHHLVIRDWANDRALHFWVAEVDEANHRIFGEWGGVFPANSDGNSLAPDYTSIGYGVNEATINRATGAGAVYGATAAGTSSYQGVITFDDLERGYIDHALIFATKLAEGRTPGLPESKYFYPATTHNGQASGPDRIECGVRFQLQMSDAAINAISSEGQRMIARAAKDYGLFMVDYAGSMMTVVAQRPRVGAAGAAERALFSLRGFSAPSSSPGPGNDGWNPLNQIDWSTMRALILL